MSLITAYDRLPVTFTHGEGVWLYDEENKAYLDAMCGVGVCGLGHAHPEVTRTITQQAAKLLHVSNGYEIKEQEELAHRLTALSGMEQAFFGNSGAEANEAAIKLTRLYGHKKGINCPMVIVMTRAFHGRTMGTLSASGSHKMHAGFEPLVPGFIRVPFNDISAIESIAAKSSDVVAVMLETIQGEGGVFPLDTDYLPKLAKICTSRDWLLILDEVQTGNARTGKFFSYQHSCILPDVVTTAKGLGNGIPIGVCLIGKKACDLFKPGNHGSTFGGNPFACATALTVVEQMERAGFYEMVTQNSLMLKEELTKGLKNNNCVRNIRGKGYMLGIELDRAAKKAKQIALTNGLLINVTAETVIRLLPPLILQENEIELLVSRLIKTLRTIA